MAAYALRRTKAADFARFCWVSAVIARGIQGLMDED
jgi:hypothetical protein